MAISDQGRIDALRQALRGRMSAPDRRAASVELGELLIAAEATGAAVAPLSSAPVAPDAFSGRQHQTTLASGPLVSAKRSRSPTGCGTTASGVRPSTAPTSRPLRPNCWRRRRVILTAAGSSSRKPVAAGAPDWLSAASAARPPASLPIGPGTSPPPATSPLKAMRARHAAGELAALMARLLAKST